MKKSIWLLLLILLAACLPAGAIESTAYTYTESTDMYIIRTQDAYLPGGIMLREAGMKSPEDIFIHAQTMYIADTGNGRILRYNMKTGRVDFLGQGLLKQPTGVCVGADGALYVADYGAGAVVVLDKNGALARTIGRPEAALYGKNTAYKPQKVAVDQFGNLYVTSEGTHEGILQFDIHGNFAGFFGANKTANLSLMEWVQETFYTREQKAKLFLRNPPRIVNVEVSRENLIYSVTQLNSSKALKKLNMAGINILLMGTMRGESNFVDVAIAPGGEMLAVTDTGAIVEYDADGRYVFAFGGRAVSADRNGLTSVVSALAVDESYNLFVLDKQRGVVQPFAPTDFAKSIHQGLAYYRAGQYASAAEIWESFLKLTPRASFAHWGYGLALWQMGEYKSAQEHLELVRDFGYASDAFWERRNDWLTRHLGTALLAGIGLLAVGMILSRVRRRHDFLRPATHMWRRWKKQSRLLCDITYTRHMVRHPIDALYDLKHGIHGTVKSASVLYLAALAVWLIDAVYTAGLFNTMAFSNEFQNPLITVSLAVIPTLLFVIGNYFISSINDGEGSFRNVYIAVAYAFSFYIWATPVTTLVSYVLTLNEGFVYAMARGAIWGYTLVLIFLAAKETHAYTAGGTIKNLLLTVCFMVLAVLVLVILYMMWNELIGFVATVAEEVRYRV